VKATSSPPHRRVLALAALLGVVAASLVALALPATAMATPCGDKVLADWFDNGRIDRLYDLHCYEDAIDAIPNDLRDYANAEEIISRALQAAVNGNLDPGGPDPSPGDSGGGGSNPPTDPADPGEGSVASPDVDTTGLSSVPIPLIVLGAMSLALLTAGGLGYLRRRHATDDLDDPDDHLPV
jgi:hypothetical protein